MNLYSVLLATDFTVDILPSFSNRLLLLIPIIIYIALLGLGLYALILIVRALRIYIKKNS